jgi:seryl-tRNA synthetase
VSEGYTVVSRVAVPARGRELVRYAAAFIDPAIRCVRIEDGAFVVETVRPVGAAAIDAGLERLVARFAGAGLPEPEAAFRLSPPEAFADRSGELPEGALQRISPGLFVFRRPLSDLLRFLDWAMLTRFAVPFSASEETYPNVIPIDALAGTQHFSSFPEHIHFVTHLIEDLDVLDGFAGRARRPEGAGRPVPGEMADAELVHNPATCYHCYAARKGERLEGNLAVTAISRCHRYESANHAERGRLLEFSLREVIFLGAPDYVREARERVLELVRELVQGWELYGELLPANDPFFTSDFEPKAAQQRRLAMKFEYRAALPGGAGLAVMSSNLHGPTFGKAFAISLDGRPASTGCLGFGLERLALALVAQHGVDAAAWPEGLRRDYGKWRRTDPLAS